MPTKRSPAKSKRPPTDLDEDGLPVPTPESDFPRPGKLPKPTPPSRWPKGKARLPAPKPAPRATVRKLAGDVDVLTQRLNAVTTVVAKTSRLLDEVRADLIELRDKR